MNRHLNRDAAPSIQRRLAMLVLAVIAPFAALAGWLIFEGYQNQRQAMESHLLDTARALSLIVEAELHEREARLEVLASSPHLVTGDYAAFRAQALQVTIPSAQWVILVDGNNQQQVNTGTAAGAPLPQATPILDLDTAPHVGRSYISNLRIGAVSKQPVLFLSQSLPQGSMKGRLQLSIAPRVFTQSLLDHRIAGGWLVALLDREGTIAARSRDAERFVGKKASDSMLERMNRAAEGLAETITLDGVPSLTAHHRSDLSGWTIVVSAPQSAVWEAAKQLLEIGFGATFIVALLAIALAIWVGRAIVRAVRLLAADTHALAGGGLRRIRSTGIFETDVVSQALAKTSQEIAAREAELSRARDQAISASAAKDQFLAALSHELRTPLNPVLLLASEGASDASLPATIRQTFTVIEKNALLEARLIDDLLDLTRIISGKMTLQLREVVIDAVMRDAVESLRGPVSDKRLNLRTALSAEVSVAADPARLQQVFSNLLTNAVKFTPVGGSINVSSRIDREGRAVIIEISDTGMGMTAEELRRIFERFAQGDHASSTGSHQFGGLGLGLVITRNIVEMHHGRIEAFSAGREKGSRFTVWLPASGR